MSTQRECYEWAVATFGTVATLSHERALRLIEESLELVQAVGLSREDIIKVLDRTYSREVGLIPQEIGQVELTLRCLAHQCGFNVEHECDLEFERVTAIPPEHWEKRHENKVDAGTAEPIGVLSEMTPNEPKRDQTMQDDTK